MNNKPVAELVLEQMAVGDASRLRVKWLMDGYPPVGTKLYTHPAKELTDEEIATIRKEVWDDNKFISEIFNDFARAILLKAQEK